MASDHVNTDYMFRSRKLATPANVDSDRMNTDYMFRPGKLTTLLDASAGSSGKGKMADFICEHANNYTFLCNTFAPQAGHWVRNDRGEFFYQTLNSHANNPDKYEKLYIGPGATIELPALFTEIEKNSIPPHKLGIHPLAQILQPNDSAYERGIMTFDGKPTTQLQDGTMKCGSTAHGCGAARARRILRRQEAVYAKDTPSLSEFICDTTEEILARLDKGESGFLEIAQGFQLSLMYKFFPYCTSRNVTVASALNDMMLPTRVAGPVIINMRTYPIRINNDKWLDSITGEHLTYEQILEYDKDPNKKYTIYRGNSGGGYPDQAEITWDDVTNLSGAKKKIMECTSVTKLPRRVFTFSLMNLKDCILYNDTGDDIYLCINFANYVDANLEDDSGTLTISDLHGKYLKIYHWLRNHGILDVQREHTKVHISLIGTGAKTNSMLLLKD